MIRRLQVSCGSRHTLCLNDDGRVFCFGWGAMGQLGGDGGDSRDFPVEIADFTATGIVGTQWGTVITVAGHPGALS